LCLDILVAQAQPPREYARRLRAFVTRVLADADAAGLTVDDVIAGLGDPRRQAQPREH